MPTHGWPATHPPSHAALTTLVVVVGLREAGLVRMNWMAQEAMVVVGDWKVGTEVEQRMHFFHNFVQLDSHCCCSTVRICTFLHMLVTLNSKKERSAQLVVRPRCYKLLDTCLVR